MEINEFLKELAFDIRLFSRLAKKELDKESIEALKNSNFPLSLCLDLNDEPIANNFNDMKSYLEKLDLDNIDELLAEYAAIFLNNRYDVCADESAWIDEDGLIMQSSTLEIRKIYEKYNLKTDNKNISEDNLSNQLEFIAYLFDNGAEVTNLYEVCDFMDKHLLVWFGEFSTAIYQRCENDFYASTIALNYIYMVKIRELLADILNKPVNILELKKAQDKAKAKKAC